MTEIHFHVAWDEGAQRMRARFEAEGQVWVEAFTRRQWRKFIYDVQHDAKKLRFGGLRVVGKGKAGRCWQLTAALRDYLLKVDEAFRLTGQTTFLKG